MPSLRSSGMCEGTPLFSRSEQTPAQEKNGQRELTRLLQSEPDRYPILLDVIRSGAFSQKVDAAFEFGLDCILDGIRARASKRNR